jgi:tRNA(Ile)-lysidine synthetase-like protein
MKTTGATSWKRPEEAVIAALEAHVHAYSLQHRLFSPGTMVVVAVSGGADSLCLLHCLHALATQLSIRLHVAHMHHGLRGEDADRDAEFVAHEASALRVDCSIERVDVRAAHDRVRGSLEAVARRLRYQALHAVAARVGARCVAVAHTRDDQAETLLMNLLRGAGLEGLSGMRPRERTIVRPLLDTARAEVEAYNVACGCVARVDATNDDTAFRRNAIRHEVIPMLERFNPRVKEALSRTAMILAHDADYLRAEAADTLARLQLPNRHDLPKQTSDLDVPAPGQTVTGGEEVSRGGRTGTDVRPIDQADSEISQYGMPGGEAVPPCSGMALHRRDLARLPQGLRLHVIRHAIEQVAGSTDGITTEHLLAVDALATSTHAGRCYQLPNKLCAEAWGNTLKLDIARPPKPPLAQVELPVPGTALFGCWELHAEMTPRGGGMLPAFAGRAAAARASESTATSPTLAGEPRAEHTIHTTGLQIIVPRSALQLPLAIRRRQPGDRIERAGARGHRKLQDIFVDARVPLSERDAIPLVCDTLGIFWVVGHAQDARTTQQGNIGERIRISAYPRSIRPESDEAG